MVCRSFSISTFYVVARQTAASVIKRRTEERKELVTCEGH